VKIEPLATESGNDYFKIHAGWNCSIYIIIIIIIIIIIVNIITITVIIIIIIIIITTERIIIAS